MYISKINVLNYRLLKNTSINCEKNLSLTFLKFIEKRHKKFFAFKRYSVLYDYKQKRVNNDIFKFIDNKEIDLSKIISFRYIDARRNVSNVDDSELSTLSANYYERTKNPYEDSDTIIIRLYENNEYNEFIRKTSFQITRISDKILLKEKISILVSMYQESIHNVICYAHDSGLCLKDDIIEDFIKNNEYLYNRVSKVNYEEFVNLYFYLEGYTPFSTQHKIKGEEYKNVLVILDNGKWTKYNFEYLFHQSHPKCNQNVLKRTQKLFYVCCTRAKDNLCVYIENPTKEMIDTAVDWFGKDNCVPV